MFDLLCAGLRLLALQSQLSTCDAPVQSQPAVLSQVTANYSDPWRPQVHYTPQLNWLNDPNGLFKNSDGLWHMYYQYADSINPGDDKDWGHATSHDLYSWSNEPIAISHSSNGSIWSGCTVIDVNNTSGFFPNQTNGVVAIYTNWTPAEEAQAIAYSYDGGYSFVKYSGNPIISLSKHGFRDPKVIWHDKTQKWVMAVSHADDHFIEFYTSTNLTTWTPVSTFSNAAIAGTFECPQFLPIPFRQAGTQAQSPEYYLLSISLGGGGSGGTSIVKYFPGTFNGTHFTAVDDLATRVVDFGPDFYATSFFFNSVSPTDPNPISMSWAANLNYAGGTPSGDAEGWRSTLTAARTHYLANVTAAGYDLISEPYNTTPLIDRVSSEKHLGNGGLIIDYSTLPSRTIEFHLNLTSSSTSNARVELNFTSSGTRESITFLLNVAASSSSSVTLATFEMSRQNISGWSSSLPLSTPSVANLVPTSIKSRQGSSSSETYDFHGIVDRTVVEAFLNGGVDAGTMIFFPSGELDTMVLNIEGLGTDDFVDFEAWGLKSGWESSSKTVRHVGRSAMLSGRRPRAEL